MPHIHELIDFTIEVFIVNKGRVLLVNHKKLNKWLPIGGHIELNEDPEETLFREVKEECGLKIEILGKKPIIQADGVKFLYPPKFLDIHRISKTHRHVGLNYFAKTNSDKFVFNKEEHNEIRWFTKKELDKPEFNLAPDVKFYAKEALAKINSTK